MGLIRLFNRISDVSKIKEVGLDNPIKTIEFPYKYFVELSKIICKIDKEYGKIKKSTKEMEGYIN